jgi:2-polyprenyl-6-methoxyphenol hydroxylase-like FAD-dependent oxidoreductase
MITTDLLIIGTGPAGAALACFLTSHGKHEILDILQFTDEL